MKNIILILSVLSILSGCTTLGIGERSEFTCSAIPKGGHCLPASKFYELTEDSDNVEEALALAALEDGGSVVYTKFDKEDPKIILPTMDQPVSVFTPPEIARIFVSPYIDDDGDLNMASYIYVVVTEGKWSVGSGSSSFQSPNLFPLQSGGKNSKNLGNDIENAAKEMTAPLKNAFPFAAQLAKDGFQK
jgi:conjugal transfer pilus assembly protein TraV